MIKQTVLPFKPETTNDLITSHAGLVLLGEFAVALGLPRMLDEQLPTPGSGVGYRASEHVLPLVLMLNGGGRSLEDLRELRADHGLRKLLAMERIPSSDATGDWLRRSFANGGLEALAAVNRGILKRVLTDDGISSSPLDMDATGIEAQKQTARFTCKGCRGYMPLVGHLAERGGSSVVHSARPVQRESDQRAEDRFWHGSALCAESAGYLLAPSPGAGAAVETLRDGGQGGLSWWRTLVESQASCERPLRCRTIAKPAMCLWIRRYTIRKEP